MVHIPINIPDQKFGKWKIESFTLSEVEAENYWNRQGDWKERFIPSGVTYKRLLRFGKKDPEWGSTIMSNTPAEVTDHIPFLTAAKGRVLIFGLGLGMIVQALIEKDNIDSITVVEIDREIIEVCGNYYRSLSTRVQIIEGNAHSYYNDGAYDAIWFDIWDTISVDNIPEMECLKLRWKKNSPVRMCWAERYCKKMLEKEKEIRDFFMSFKKM